MSCAEWLVPWVTSKNNTELSRDIATAHAVRSIRVIPKNACEESEVKDYKDFLQTHDYKEQLRDSITASDYRVDYKRCNQTISSQTSIHLQ